MNKIIDFEDIKNKKIEKKYILYVVILVIVIYIFYSMYLLLRTPTETFSIESGTVTQEESATGYIIRNEVIVKGEKYESGITPIISEGERAAKGQKIFRYTSDTENQIKEKIDALNLKIQQALENQPAFYSNDIKNLEKQIDSKISNLKDMTDLETIAEYKKELEEIITKKAKISGELSQSGSYIKELSTQKEEYEKQLENSSEYVIASEAGVVSYRVDGFENILTGDDFGKLTEESLENLGIKTGKIIASSNSQGKIVDNFKCYLVTVLSGDLAKNAQIGKSVKITLSGGSEIEANVNYIAKQDNNKILIVFELNKLIEELLQYRKISFNITWWSISGLKVPNSAIAEDEKGLKYVVRKKAGLNKKILVKILKKNDKYSIIESYSTDELNSLGIDISNYSKISQYDIIMRYADFNKVEK